MSDNETNRLDSGEIERRSNVFREIAAHVFGDLTLGLLCGRLNERHTPTTSLPPTPNFLWPPLDNIVDRFIEIHHAFVADYDVARTRNALIDMREGLIAELKPLGDGPAERILVETMQLEMKHFSRAGRLGPRER